MLFDFLKTWCLCFSKKNIYLRGWKYALYLLLFIHVAVNRETAKIFEYQVRNGFLWKHLHKIYEILTHFPNLINIFISTKTVFIIHVNKRKFTPQIKFLVEVPGSNKITPYKVSLCKSVILSIITSRGLKDMMSILLVQYNDPWKIETS